VVEQAEVKNRRYRGQDAEQRRAERMEKLLEAGLALFGTQGYATTSVKNVCDAAGLTERYFYESYANREALLVGVYLRLSEQLANAILASFKDVPAGTPQLVKAGLTAFYSWFQDDPRRARVMLSEILGVSRSVDKVYRNALRGFAGLIASQSPSFTPSEGPPSGVNPELIAAGLAGAALQIVNFWALGGFSDAREEVVENCYSIFMAVIERGQRTA
jgi:AcrR family transcriptional regulator